jgi:hypothetical protein
MNLLRPGEVWIVGHGEDKEDWYGDAIGSGSGVGGAGEPEIAKYAWFAR